MFGGGFAVESCSTVPAPSANSAAARLGWALASRSIMDSSLATRIRRFDRLPDAAHSPGLQNLALTYARATMTQAFLAYLGLIAGRDAADFAAPTCGSS